MKRKILKSFMTLGMICCLSSCTSIKNYFGEKDIKNATKIYNKEGITLKGVKKLTDGMEAIPNSQEGLYLFNAQYNEMIARKDNILKNKNLSKEDIDKLLIYVYAGERAEKLSKKVPQISYDSKKYNHSKQEIIKKLENYFLKTDYKAYSRKDKIRKINECKYVLKYISSPKISNLKSQLEEEITINISIVSTRLGYDTISNIIRGELYKLSTEYKDVLLDDYIFFRGYGKDSETDYLVELEIFKENIYTKRISIEENENKEKVFLKEKEVVLSGYYNLIKVSDRKVLNRRQFELNKGYSIKTIHGENQMLFDSEREIVERTINEELRNIFIRDIEILIDDSNL